MLRLIATYSSTSALQLRSSHQNLRHNGRRHQSRRPTAPSVLAAVAASKARASVRPYCSHATRSTPSGPLGAIVDQVADLLPHQGILENFVHHNPLEPLEPMRFPEAVSYMHKMESYMSPGERMFMLTKLDPRKRVNEALVDLTSAFLDRGGAKWAPAHREHGFLYFFASLENLGLAPWRRHARLTAQRILSEFERKDQDLAEVILKEDLEFLGVPPEEWSHAIHSTMFDLKGWAGMFRRMETHPSEAPTNTKVRLLDFCVVQFILTRSSMEALARHQNWDLITFSLPALLNAAPKTRPPQAYHHHHGPLPWHTSAIATVDQTAERRELLEAEVEGSLLKAISNDPHSGDNVTQPRPKMQVYTCIDDRECSFRRHMEEDHPREIETFGVAGFFGIPIKYQPADGRDTMILAPEGQNPTAVLAEDIVDHKASFKRRRRWIAQISRFWESASFSPSGSLFLTAFAPITWARLALMGFAPSLKHTVKDWFKDKVIPKTHTEIQVPFSPEQSASMLARTFKDVGTHKRFAPVVIVIGHGASSVNNPFAAAYNCGACGGREGGPNARLLARMANDPAVRQCLAKNHDVIIPDDTVFVGAMHNTTTDTVEFFDLEKMPATHKDRLAEARKLVRQATGRNALERVDRFLLARNHVHTPEEALAHVRTRAIDPAEVRPELNHATNGAVVVGRRDLTKGRSLDRRAFLPSYDPFNDDDAGTNLEHVLGPALIVSSGINLEYLFSTIEADSHGAGTKAPLNIVGNIGVLQGTTGDLRPGLPTQMTEMHLPVRALFVVDAPVARVEAVLSRRPELKRLVRNDWVRFVVRDPTTGAFFKQVNGEYVPVDITDEDLNRPEEVKPENVTVTLPPAHDPHHHDPHHDVFHHRVHGDLVALKETRIYWASTIGMVLSAAIPVYLYGATAMNPYGAAIAIAGTMLSLPVLAFTRRYLHGDFMFGRISGLITTLVLGFNLIATAPNLELAMLAWSLFGFASTFLIGAYNDRPTVRNNATFAFAAYRISDMGMLVATALTAHAGAAAAGFVANPAVAIALIIAAMFKSSQWPLTSLFVRSMEGPTPASALGYAGLSAHVGVVLLTSTMPLWFGFGWARAALAAVGLITAVHSTLVSKVRSDRKGAIASATSATLGSIFIVLALGYPGLALLMSFGHAAFRMIQILRAPNVISESQQIRSALGFSPWPKIVPDWLYRISWTLRRLDTDFHMIYLLHRISQPFLYLWPESRRLSKTAQWVVTAVCILLAGAPYTPISSYFEETIMDLIHTHPLLAGLLMVLHSGFAILLMRFLFVNVLHARRFFSNQKALPAPSSGHGQSNGHNHSHGPASGPVKNDPPKAA